MTVSPLLVRTDLFISLQDHLVRKMAAKKSQHNLLTAMASVQATSIVSVSHETHPYLILSLTLVLSQKYNSLNKFEIFAAFRRLHRPVLAHCKFIEKLLD